MKKVLFYLFVVAGVSSQAYADPFVYGISIPLSGDLTEYGVAVKNGIELARLEDPSAFKNIQVVYEDNEYSSSKGVTVLRRFAINRHANLVYQWGEDILQATAPIIEAEKIPTLAMSVDASSAIGKHFIIRTINHSGSYADAILAELRSKAQKQIALLVAEDTFLTSLADSFKKKLHADESITSLASVSVSENDFNSVIAKLRFAKFDSIGVLLLPGQGSTFYRQAATLGLKAASFGSDTFDSQTVIKNSNGTMNGVSFPTIALPRSFIQSYRLKYHNDIEVAYAYNAYTVAKFVAQKFGALNKSVANTDVIHMLKEVPAEHPFGFSFAEDGEGGSYYKFPLVLKEIKNNESQLLP
jgi:branched-chain amino acid transport system substrate-binding protein